MQQYFSSRSGSIMPMFAISITALIGVVAVALALAADSKAANEIQNTADAAAVAGATAFVTLDSPKEEVRLQQALQAAEDFTVANSEYTLVEIDVQAITEDPYGQRTRIDVELEFQPANIMARVAGRSGNVSVRRRASAEAVWGFPLCALALAEDDAGFGTAGSARFQAENCIVWSNSDSYRSINLTGGGLQAKQICSAGRVRGKSRASPTPEEDCKPIPDPLLGWTPPAPATCLDPAVSIASDAVDRAGLDALIDKILVLPLSGDAYIAAVDQLYAPNPLLDLLTGGSDGDTGGSAGDIENAAAEITGNGNGNGNGNGGGNGAADAIWQHPAFAFSSKGVVELGEDGRFVRGPAQGLDLYELGQLAGLIDNAPEERYLLDAYIDQPTIKLSPGTYCGMDIFEGHIQLDPGVYHIRNAPLVVRRKATLSGEGVTIILHGDDATFGVLDGGRLNLSAPTSGDTAGFALVEDASASLSTSGTQRSRLTGDGEVNAIGTVYLPRQDFAITGSGAGEQASPLLQIVANRILLSDQGKLHIDFDPTQTQVPVGILPERTARLTQ